MQVFTTVNSLQTYIRTNNHIIQTAFVPTLGALHQGHLTLMDSAKKLADCTIASIFVNPTQFNDAKDLEKYPRPLLNDIHLLELQGVDILFLPKDDEIYPPGLDLSVNVNLEALTSVLEGPNRPGHFDGVVTVVKRLLDIVQPHYLIMGQKDYQQQAIIAEMIRQLDMSVQLITHPTIREADGLAMSSRNTRIDPNLRLHAPTLYKSLCLAKELTPDLEPGEIEKRCSSMISNQGFKLEYFSIINGETLQPIKVWAEDNSAVACVAAWLGDVRLIDNEILYSNMSKI